MMDQNSIIVHVIKSEGGEAINYDEGSVYGVSKFGVTMVALAEFRKVDLVTKEDVFDLNLDEAIAIYKKYYWDKIGLDTLSATPYLQAILFDQAVNRGAATVARQFCLFLNYRFKTTFPEVSKLTPEMGEYLATLDKGYFTREMLSECQIQYNKLALKAWDRWLLAPSEENAAKLRAKLKNLNGWTMRLKSLSHFLASFV